MDKRSGKKKKSITPKVNHSTALADKPAFVFPKTKNTPQKK